MPKPAIVVGRGRMGRALERWLRTASVPVRMAPGRSPERVRRAWRDMEPGLLLLAVPDDALSAVARELAGWGWWRGWRIAHTSGARPAAVLEPLRRAGAAVASMHPMMTLPGRRVAGPLLLGVAPAGRSVARLRLAAAYARSARGVCKLPPVVSPAGVVFSLEGDAAAVREAAALVRAWGGQPLRLTAPEKAAYHLAATLVGPGAVVAMAVAEEILRQAGLGPRQTALARAGLIRLLSATAGNLDAGDTAAAFTGPWARGDRGTINIHEKLLKNKRLLRLYRAIEAASRRI